MQYYLWEDIIKNLNHQLLPPPPPSNNHHHHHESTTESLSLYSQMIDMARMAHQFYQSNLQWIYYGKFYHLAGLYFYISGVVVKGVNTYPICTRTHLNVDPTSIFSRPVVGW